MNDDIAQAFAHPEYRARATADSSRLAIGLTDRISLRNHIVTVEIGAFQVERDVTQRLEFNVVVEVAAAPTPLQDDVDNILSYDLLTAAIATELAAERLNLLETLAERIAARILAAPQALRVFLRIEKLDRGPGALGVEIVREKTLGGTVNPQQTAAPVVVFLSAAALAHSGLPAFIGRLFAAQGAARIPAILTVEPRDFPVPQAAGLAQQRHIDLLAIEQSAWGLAGQDSRLMVVESRAEIDWAMHQGRISIWAPSKLILAATDGPQGAIAPAALAQWLARQLAATEILSIGYDMGDTPVKTRNINIEDTP